MWIFNPKERLTISVIICEFAMRNNFMTKHVAVTLIIKLILQTWFADSLLTFRRNATS